jgi:hypothetical protein
MDEKIFLILFEKGILAAVVLIIGFFLNAVLQANKLRGETVAELAKERAAAYGQLWKELALIRPADNEEVSSDQRKQMEQILADWYHEHSGALYMSWLTARRYMLVRRALDDTNTTSKCIRKQISLLRTRLKIDCGIYSYLEGLLPLPSRLSANKSLQPTAKRGG